MTLTVIVKPMIYGVPATVARDRSARPVNDLEPTVLIKEDPADPARHLAAVRQAQLTSTDYDTRRF